MQQLSFPLDRSPVFHHSVQLDTLSHELLRFMNSSNGAWARLAAAPDGSAHGLFYNGSALFVLRPADTRGSPMPTNVSTNVHGETVAASRRRLLPQIIEDFGNLPRDAAWLSVSSWLPHPQRGRRVCAACPTGPPYGRLPGCPAELRVLPLGMLVDRGFAAAAGGKSAAMQELGSALNNINGLFEDQFGLRLEARYVIIGEAGMTFAEAGPNWDRGVRPRRSEAGIPVDASGEVSLRAERGVVGGVDGGVGIKCAEGCGGG